ncbi:metal-dependent hydrolase [Nitrincola alkalilacustris]|uniref:metal-dependent hydrolase n=1 Tax=Nitrincola alkalilacustris TaxID=1571224 RepID=UPI001456F361|nr:metal-dependent hydrolase [Nitrincola alkalilacustris]
MDLITHALSGAVACHLVSPKHPGPQQFTHHERLLLGAGAAMFPDSDWLTRPFVDTLVFLELHQGITHSIIMLPIWALILSWIITPLWKHKRDWRDAACIIAIGIGMHIAGDLITNYGTRILSPLSDARYSFPVVFLVDPWITAILLAGVISAWLSSSRTGASISLGAVAVVILFYGVIHLHVLDIGKAAAKSLSKPARQVQILPAPINPLHRRIIITTDTTQLEAHVGLFRGTGEKPTSANPVLRHWQAFRPPDSLHWQAYPRYGDDSQSAFVQEAWLQPELKQFRDFATLPYLWQLQQQDGNPCALFSDLRFRTEGFDAPPFRFGICRDPSGHWYDTRAGFW